MPLLQLSPLAFFWLTPHPTPFPITLFFSLFLVVAKLDGQTVSGTAESSWLDFPVGYRVAKKADAMVRGTFYSKSYRTEVIHSDLSDVVGVKVHNLQGEGKLD